jgi:hypothetical protein
VQQLTLRVATGHLRDRFGECAEHHLAQGQISEIETLVTATTEHRHARPTSVGHELLRYAALADAGLPVDEHQVRKAAPRQLQACPKPVELEPPSDERSGLTARNLARRRPHAAIMPHDHRE